MYVRTIKNKKGETRFEISEKYKHPLTGKWKTVTESFYKDTARERKMAERRLLSKIAKILDDLERTYNPEKITTFGQLKESWLQNWSVSVKPQTIEREKLVIRRLGEIIGDDYLLSKITPMLMRDSLMTYALMYDASHSTMTHIKSTCNRFEF